MPGRNGRGPMGMGPKSGRGAGNCRGYDEPSQYSQQSMGVPGAGFGRGAEINGGPGRGRHGWRHWFFATGLPGWMRFVQGAMPVANPNPELEKQALKSQAETLQSELDSIKRRLSELDTEPKQ
jgi:hypothetical protein